MASEQNGTGQQSRPMRFGDRVRLIHASENNPLREGYFVERGYRKGFLNRGTFIRITNGRGRFWTAPPDAVELVT